MDWQKSIGSRTVVAVVGLVASLGVSLLAWVVFDVFFLFLFVPFVPFLLRGDAERTRPPVRECPDCGFQTRNPEYTHCPRDGTELRRVSGRDD